eukprot:1394913-Amphidinium_carterae.1
MRSLTKTTCIHERVTTELFDFYCPYCSMRHCMPRLQLKIERRMANSKTIVPQRKHSGCKATVRPAPLARHHIGHNYKCIWQCNDYGMYLLRWEVSQSPGLYILACASRSFRAELNI